MSIMTSFFIFHFVSEDIFNAKNVKRKEAKQVQKEKKKRKEKKRKGYAFNVPLNHLRDQTL